MFNTENLPTQQSRVHLSTNGRLNIPSQIRKAAGLKDGDELILTLKNNTIYLQPMEQVIAEAQHLVEEYFGNDDLLAELKEMRTKEALHESKAFKK